MASRQEHSQPREATHTHAVVGELACEPPGERESVAADDWTTLLGTLAEVVEVEASGRQYRALCRVRQIRSAADVLRLCFSYAVGDLSLKRVAQWAELARVGTLSDMAVLERLQRARPWLETLVARVLLAALPGGRAVLEGCERVSRHGKVRLVDGTVISKPGSVGTDWRVHADLDLATLRLVDVQLTDQHSGESLARHAWQPDDIAVGDRGFCRPGGIMPVLDAGAHIVVRLHPTSVRLETSAGAPVDLLAWLATGPTTAPVERPVWLVCKQRREPLRLVARALPPEQTERARAKLRKQASKHRRAASPDSLVLVGWVLLLTSLAPQAWPAADVLALYRCRWQIELLFKRLKSIWRLDHLRARDPDLAQTYLLAKLLAILLADRFTAPAHPQLDAWREDADAPLNLWRWTQTAATLITAAILGPLSLQMLLDALPRLRRSLCDPPRARPRQALTARRLASPHSHARAA